MRDKLEARCLATTASCEEVRGLTRPHALPKIVKDVNAIPALPTLVNFRDCPANPLLVAKNSVFVTLLDRHRSCTHGLFASSRASFASEQFTKIVLSCSARPYPP